MKPAEQFESFKDLQEILDASDEELGKLLKFGCEVAPVANFEDSMTEVLLRYFRYITGVPWVRAFQNGARPNQPLTGVQEGQYGTLFLLSYEPLIAPYHINHQVIDPETGEPRQDLCEEFSVLGKYTFQMDVYRDAGQAQRSQETNGVQTPVGSAFDVLLRAKLRMNHHRMQSALRQYCIQFNSNAITGVVNLPPELIQSTYETRANATLEVYAAPVSTMRLPTTDFIPVEINECEIEHEPEPEPEPVEC